MFEKQEPIEPIVKSLIENCLENDHMLLKVPDICKATEKVTDFSNVKSCITMKMIGKAISFNAWAAKACKKILSTNLINEIAKSKTVSNE